MQVSAKHTRCHMHVNMTSNHMHHRRLAQMGLLKFQTDGSIVMVPPSEAVEKLRQANESILGFEASSQTMQEKDSTYPI